MIGLGANLVHATVSYPSFSSSVRSLPKYLAFPILWKQRDCKDDLDSFIYHFPLSSSGYAGLQNSSLSETAFHFNKLSVLVFSLIINTLHIRISQ